MQHQVRWFCGKEKKPRVDLAHMFPLAAAKRHLYRVDREYIDTYLYMYIYIDYIYEASRNSTCFLFLFSTFSNVWCYTLKSSTTWGETTFGSGTLEVNERHGGWGDPENPPEVGWLVVSVCFLSGWWNFKHFLCSPRKLGKMNPIWLIFLYIFQMGWKPPTSCFFGPIRRLLAGWGGELGKNKRHEGRGLKNVTWWHVSRVSNFLVWNVALKEWVAKKPLWWIVMCCLVVCWCDFFV